MQNKGSRRGNKTYGTAQKGRFLVPDVRNNPRLENPQSYYNILAETAITASVEAVNLKHEIDYYRNEASRLIAVSEGLIFVN